MLVKMSKSLIILDISIFFKNKYTIKILHIKFRD